MLDKLKELLKRNQVYFDMYNNSNNDDCKSKYNNLIYFIAGFVTELKQGKYSRKERKYYLDILKYNKETILMYLNLANDILSNQIIDENILLNENMTFVKDLKETLDLNTLEGKKLFLNQIRNAFAHKSGKINFYIEDNIKKVRIDNKGWFSIEANLSELNNLLSKIIIVDYQNDIQNKMVNMINNVKNDNYQNISDDTVIIMLMNLLMCYNKESLFDKFMLTQSSFIDASNFLIDSTNNWNCTEQKLRQRFFDKFKILFHSDDDKKSYNREWKGIVDIDNSTNAANLTYIYDITKMPFDNYTNRHIPIPIFMNHLRNANSHGRIKIEENYFTFYDQENSSNSQPYFYMKISKEKLLAFMFDDYFVESITTAIDDHQNKYSSNLYLLEQAESVNNFSNYIDIYRNRMSNLSETEVINYMYENNKFSSYLMEYPEQIDSFLEYKLKNGEKLTTLISQIDNTSESVFNNININNKKNNKLKLSFSKKGLELYLEFLNNTIEGIKNKNNINLKDKNYEFFKIYYLFMRNLKNINPNIQYNNISELDIDIKEQIEEGIKELQYEFVENDVFLDDSESSKRIFTEVGMQESNINEIDRIVFAISFGKQKKTIKVDNKKETRHTIKNIEKHSSLAHVFEESASKNYELASEDKKRIAKVLAVNLGIRLFNASFMMWKNKFGMTPMEAEIALLTYPISVFICNLAIYKTWFDLKDKLKQIFNHKRRKEKYLDDFSGGLENEDRINGSHNIRR